MLVLRRPAATLRLRTSTSRPTVGLTNTVRLTVGHGSMKPEGETLPQFRERLEALLRELAGKGYSGRLMLYVDLKRGQVVEAGELDAKKPWTEGR